MVHLLVTISSCKIFYTFKYLEQQDSLTVTDSKETTMPVLLGVSSGPVVSSSTYLCSVSLRYFSLSAVLKRSRGFRPSLQVFTFWLSTYTSYRSFFSSKIFSVVPTNRKTHAIWKCKRCTLDLQARVLFQWGFSEMFWAATYMQRRRARSPGRWYRPH